MCQQLRSRLGDLGKALLHRSPDLRVQLVPLASEQALVRRVLHEGVFEAVHGFGRRSPLKHQFGGDQLAQRVLEFLRGNVDDGREQLVGELPADDSSDLGDLLDR